MRERVRVLTVGLAMALGISVFTGCTGNGGNNVVSSPPASEETQGKPTEGPASNEPVTLKVMTYMTGNDAWAPVFKDVIKKYMEENKNVTIEDESVPAAGNTFKNKINTSFAVGNEPDVSLAFLGADSKPLVESKKLLVWDDEFANDAAFKESIVPSALEAARYSDGKVYGIPYIGSYEGMYINKELFEKHGVAVPKNYDDLLKAVEAFKSKGITPIAVSFSEEPHYLIETFVLSLGGKEGHQTAWHESWAPAINYIKELYAKGAFPANALTIKSAAAQQMFIDQKAAMFISGSWSAGAFKDKDGKFDITGKTDIIPLPMLPNGKADPSDIISSFRSGWFVSKENNDEKKGAPLKMAKWLLTPETLSMFIEVGGVPAIKGAKAKSASEIQQKGLDMLANAKNSSSPMDSRISQQAFQKIWKDLSYIVTGRTSVEKVLEEAKQLESK